MAPWEVLSINNPRRMLGQGNRSHCLLVSCYVDQLEHKRYTLHQLASQASFLGLRRRAGPANEGVICCQPPGEPIRLPNFRKQLFRELGVFLLGLKESRDAKV